MKKFILFILVIVCGVSVYAQHSTDHPSAIYEARFTQTLPGGERLWTIDLHTSAPIPGEGLKDIITKVLRDTIYSDTLITDSIDVHLLVDIPWLIMTADTTGLGPTTDSIFIEIRKQYWDNGKWDSWAALDTTVIPAGQDGSTLSKFALWGSSEPHPWAILLQFFSKDTVRIPIARLTGQ